MRKSVQFQLDDSEAFLRKLCYYYQANSHFCLYNNNHFKSQNRSFPENGHVNSFDYMAGAGKISEVLSSSGEDSLNKLKEFHERHRDWLMGFISYDLKNELEDLKSENVDGIKAPHLAFFIPRYVYVVQENIVVIHYLPEKDSELTAKDEFDEVLKTTDLTKSQKNILEMSSRMSREQYLEKLRAIHQHLQRGDVYELNFCQEFYSEGANIQPVEVYFDLNRKSPAPFSALIKIGSHNVISASPERYLRKIGNLIVTQPIKGTARRGGDQTEDEQIKNELRNSEKERSENVMIVDLCRNDLSRIAARGSVKVNELFGLYTFPQVHQLISTVSAELREGLHFIDAIRSSFPMGSMTGAPKIRAMELIEELESSSRGIFSGSVGYITPEGDFDFNVVIRSILYNSDLKYLSVSVGGAITILSDSEEEYNECMLKAAAILEVLNANFTKQPA